MGGVSARADLTLELDGYRWIELLHRGRRSSILRGVRIRDDRPVVVKVAVDGSSARARRALLEREYELLCRLRGASSVPEVYALERGDHGWALVMADAGGATLDRTAAGTLPLADTIALALSLVDGLREIHALGVTHGALRPEHILIQPANHRASLLDFSQALLGPEERARRLAVGLPGISFAYVAPEQTGRMNRGVDQRADYYSLGVILFELTTGRLPFGRGDALELVHAHVARSPPDPRELNPALPRAVARLILKLISKDADQRYQSSSRLHADLESCRAAIARGELDFDFPLAVGDRTDHYRTPQKLYGRRDEIARLTAALDRARRGQLELVVLSGDAGSGKTELARELSQSVSAYCGYFVSGKFDQYEQSRPYPAITMAFEALVQQLLTESPERLAACARSILEALPTTARVLIELCPALECILGPQPAVPPLEGQAARNRLHQCVAFAVRAIATPEHPVCVCLDDIQWAGRDSLALLSEILASCRASAMLLIVTHRTASTAASAAGSTEYREVLRASAVPCDSITLRRLTVLELSELVADALSITVQRARPLAEIVFARTAGNPYFARAFLDTLHADGLLTLDALGDPMHLAAIRARPATENVVELLLERIGKLPAATQDLLKIAACLGNQFDHATLCEATDSAVEPDLQPALEAELVASFLQYEALESTSTPSARLHYQFTHDRVQQAALSSIEPSLRPGIHWLVGQRLYARLFDAFTPTRLFEVCSHLNRCLELLETWEQRQLIAELDLRAAKLVLQRAAGMEAIELARAGISALGGAGWELCYELTRDLHMFVAEVAFAWADHTTLDHVGQALLANARTSFDSVRLWRLQGRVHQAQSRGAEAIQLYCRALAELGVQLPSEVTEATVESELRLTAEALRDLTREQLVALPVCQETGAAMAMELLSKLVFFTYSSDHALLPVVICRLVRSSLEHGNCAESANGYTFYGYLLARDSDLAQACEFGQLALDLAHRFGDPAVLSQTYLYAHYQLLHWKLAPNELATAFATAQRYGFEAGSPINTACSMTTLCICRFWAGEPLEPLAKDMAHHRELILSFRQRLVLDWHEVLMQAIANLRGDGDQPTLLAGPIYDERVRLPAHEAARARSALSNHGVSKLLLVYLLGDEESALDWADRTRRFERHFTSAIWAVPVLFLDALARLAACDRLPERRAALLEQVSQSCEKLSAWLPYNRQHLLPKLRILQAELARLRGHTLAAGSLYEDAVELAHASGACHEEGIAAELAGRFSLAHGEGGLARSYLRTAHRAYLRWGALAKVRALEQRYPSLIPSSDVLATELAGSTEIDGLDLLSVLHASHVISSEVKLDRLLARLMSLLIESAGAQTGHLLFESAAGWLVQSGLSADAGLLTMLESLPLESYVAAGGPVVVSVVHYVARTFEPVRLEAAGASELFANDPQIAQRDVRSVLCFLMRRQDHQRVIVYLENNLVRGAFTPHSQRLLALLSSQAAISLENARLYAGLEQQVSERTRQLQERNDELRRTLDQLLDTQQKLVAQEKLAALGALTAGIAHEIKNPLNFVTNFADISLELAQELGQQLAPRLERLDPDSARRVRDLLAELGQSASKVVEHGGRASSVVNRMALHARDTRDARRAFDLNALVMQSVELSRQAEHPLWYSCVCTRCAPNLGDVEMVVADINRVLINLIHNAQQSVEIKARTAGREFQPQVLISTHDHSDEVEVRVWDNGTGIAPELADKIFLPFFTTKAPGEGTGLGLSISHDIVVREHAGRLRVRSEEGQFCEFSLVLPRRAPSP